MYGSVEHVSPEYAHVDAEQHIYDHDDACVPVWPVVPPQPRFQSSSLGPETFDSAAITSGFATIEADVPFVKKFITQSSCVAPTQSASLSTLHSVWSIETSHAYDEYSLESSHPVEMSGPEAESVIARSHQHDESTQPHSAP